MGARLLINRVEELPSYYDMKYAVLGNFSLSTRQEKYIKEDDGITLNETFETPPYHFRKLMGVVDTAKRDFPNAHNYPYYAIPGRWPYSFYVDIRRAYLQIAHAYGGETYIKPPLAVGYGEYRFDNDAWSRFRILRGLIVSGTGQEIKSTIWEDGNYHVQAHKNTLFSPHLRASVMNTLHAIAHVCKRYVIYWHTDGCIVPSMYLRKVEDILTRYGFTYAIKAEGETVVYGVGSYTIGGATTLTSKTMGKRREYILEDNPLWYLTKFAKSPNGLLLI